MVAVDLGYGASGLRSQVVKLLSCVWWVAGSNPSLVRFFPHSSNSNAIKTRRKDHFKVAFVQLGQCLFGLGGGRLMHPGGRAVVLVLVGSQKRVPFELDLR